MPDDASTSQDASSSPALHRPPKQHRASTSIRSRTSPPPGEHDPRPPTKRARKAINCEPCRNSKLKCDRYVCPSRHSHPAPLTLPPETAPALAVSSEVRLSSLPPPSSLLPPSLIPTQALSHSATKMPRATNPTSTSAMTSTSSPP